MTRRRSVIVCLLGWCITARAQTFPATQKTSDPIPAQTLQQMYARELGTLYEERDALRLISAHQLIEQFFATNFQGDRKAIIQKLQQTKLDVNLLGRLARLRMDWPELKGGVYYINERVGPYGVHYFLGVPPEYDRTKSWPLVIKLPTADAFVTEPKPTADDVQRVYTNWMTDELKAHPDALCIMPLLNLDELWGPSYAGMNSVIQPMLHAANRCNVDPARVYMLGHSMSAHAVWNLALHYPTYFASFNPLAGGAGNDWQRLRIMNLRNIFPVIWHDADDQVIKVESSRGIVNVLKRLKIPCDYNETKGIGHVPPESIAQACYAKMRQTVRDLYPEHVSLQSNRPEPTFNRVDWLQLYQPMRPGDEKKLNFRRGAGHMIVMSNTWTAQGNLARGANRFEITCDNVEVMRLCVNDQMIDFKKPVTVVVNRRQRFEGIVQPSVEEMLNDQLFLGRGWRYFGGVIDIDLSPKPATGPEAHEPRE
jgi:hypothetical protein